MGVVLEFRRPPVGYPHPGKEVRSVTIEEERRAYAVLSRALNAIAPTTVKECASMAQTIDNAFMERRAKTPSGGVRAEDRDGRILMRARCNICHRRCKGRLPPLEASTSD